MNESSLRVDDVAEVPTTPNWSTIVASSTGGPEGTNLIQLLNLALTLAPAPIRGATPTMVSVDAGGTTASRLRLIEKDTIDLRCSTTLGAQLSVATAAGLDPLLPILLERETVLIDLGPTTVDWIFAWAAYRCIDKFLDGRSFALLVPMTCEPKSILEGIGMLEKSETGMLPIAKSVAGFVGNAGEYEKMATNDRLQLENYCESRSIPIVRLPRLNPAFSAWRIPFGDFWQFSVLEYQAKVVDRGGPRPEMLPTSTMMARFGEHASTIGAQLAECGLLPPFAFPEKKLTNPGEDFRNQ